MKEHTVFTIRRNVSRGCSVSSLILLLICLATSNPAHACTVVTIARDGKAFVGNNEDGIELRTKLWFFPPSDSAHGRMFWGFDRSTYTYQGGMNDQGLFYDITAIDYTGWHEDPAKPDFNDDEQEYVLSHFATVDEVVEFFSTYDIDLGWVTYIFADAHGKSAVIEWTRGKLQILTTSDSFQVATNYAQSNYDVPTEFPPCYRFRTAYQMLSQEQAPSIDVVRGVLSACHFEAGWGTTVYSNICDLVNKKVYLYHFHNFEEAVVLDLREELEKGEHAQTIPDMFKVRPYSERLHRGSGVLHGGAELQKVIGEKGLEGGISAYYAMKDSTRTNNRFLFQDWMLRDVGMYFLRDDRLAEATAVFELCVKEYPQYGEARCDLAGAYLKKGDTLLAVENYRKALELDSANGEIRTIAKNLENKRDR